MRWLSAELRRPVEFILDLLVGSGTTLEAAALEGIGALGIKRDDEAIDLSVLRLHRMDGLEWQVLRRPGTA